MSWGKSESFAPSGREYDNLSSSKDLFHGGHTDFSKERKEIRNGESSVFRPWK